MKYMSAAKLTYHSTVPPRCLQTCVLIWIWFLSIIWFLPHLPSFHVEFWNTRYKLQNVASYSIQIRTLKTWGKLKDTDTDMLVFPKYFRKILLTYKSTAIFGVTQSTSCNTFRMFSITGRFLGAFTTILVFLKRIYLNNI